MGWPRSATMSDGIVSERATWAPRIGEIVSGSLLAFLNGRLLPTLLAVDDALKGGGSNSRRAWAKRGGILLPTPISSDGLGGGAFEDPEAAKERSPRRGQKLQDMLALLPTPTAERYGTNAGGQNPGPPRPGLDTMAAKGLLPTPVASDGDKGSCNYGHGEKNPGLGAVAKRLMGTPTDSMEPQGDDKGYLKHQVRGPLSPSLHLWLMAWPDGASDSEPLEKESFRSWLRSHGID